MLNKSKRRTYIPAPSLYSFVTYAFLRVDCFPSPGREFTAWVYCEVAIFVLPEGFTVDAKSRTLEKIPGTIDSVYIINNSNNNNQITNYF